MKEVNKNKFKHQIIWVFIEIDRNLVINTHKNIEIQLIKECIEEIVKKS